MTIPTSIERPIFTMANLCALPVYLFLTIATFGAAGPIRTHYDDVKLCEVTGDTSGEKLFAGIQNVECKSSISIRLPACFVTHFTGRRARSVRPSMASPRAYIKESLLEPNKVLAKAMNTLALHLCHQWA